MSYTVMPKVQEMDSIILDKLKTGTIGLRILVQKNSDLSENDIAADFVAMEKARKDTPRELVYGI